MLDKKICREFAAPGIAMSMNSGLLHAEQVKYIVQTAVKIISHKRTLVLYIHDRERAARGDLRPLWTMFHSKDGYITLERKEDGGTKWRTASFGNLEKDWHFVSSCAFYSPGDQERLERYFHSEGHGLFPLLQAQGAMMARRLEQRLEKRRQKVRDRMDRIPALPRGWKSWAYRTALPNYFFYDAQKGHKAVKGVCTGCGREITLSGVKYGAKGTCPHCDRELIMKSRGRRGWVEDRDTCQIIQRTALDEIVIRIIKVGCYYKGDTPVRETHENARLFIRFDASGQTRLEEYYYSYSGARWKPGPRPVYSIWCYNYEADISGHVYCKNLPEVFENTPWKYCPLAAFYQHFRKPMAAIPELLKSATIVLRASGNGRMNINDAMFNSAMKAAANDPMPVPGSPFYPVFAQARQGKVPEVQAETVYDDMPKLKPFVPGTPFDTDIAACTPLVMVPPRTRLPGSPAVRTYASRYYAFAWWERDMSGDELTVYVNSAKNLFRFKNYLEAYGPNAKDAFSYPIEIAPPAYAMKGTGIADDCRTQRIILVHTLLDLDRVLQETCHMRVLSDDMAASLTTERDSYQ